MRLLEALRQWEATAGTPPSPAAPITLDAIRTTAECALSLYRKGDPGGEFPAALGAVTGCISGLLAYAERHLDTGRVVVRETLRRARAVKGGEQQPSQEVAVVVRDLVCLLGSGSGAAETP
ncbi:hypothetical protein [Streptomyces catenulae]|uniref:Uncharacterized protein n=1 Tax=Streptomyces catenulae TaxID=66875 RepID=A0ABV2YYB5_9ACTN|nr:hypothetical protein [Streptomyces catenulae]